ncbi:uncharacterized protein PITG_09272 [Phytophthora infestans T30-4]|uniref:Uncharacterized protein n=1 Tax=Phytophthora infestans (strain T30-4) TaxID=403677 RepID=D0NBA6_PHYIT|nr:uncharacterized protein PITG_09272 [Phytophthora infestans T30-4]EEY55335.1 hypothetical protein PITG_09272 [Phytophthora infestans T30-4]|eukprot:XP_002903559.1 hypothetical protein PITG_09272 [Phytophthora infestans T30-4]
MGPTASLSSYTTTTPSTIKKWCSVVSGTAFLKGSYGISSRCRSLAAAPAERGLVCCSVSGDSSAIFGSLTVIHFLRSVRHLRMSSQTSLVSLSTSPGAVVIWILWP